mmetsp:Transcript_39992/g.96545  ORF Transcript_39992/g.96545 Transcript_39992/m.96545 type:complete len:744 (-) Transcript_39992:75-2306(-)
MDRKKNNDGDGASTAATIRAGGGGGGNTTVKHAVSYASKLTGKVAPASTITPTTKTPAPTTTTSTTSFTSAAKSPALAPASAWATPSNTIKAIKSGNTKPAKKTIDGTIKTKDNTNVEESGLAANITPSSASASVPISVSVSDDPSRESEDVPPPSTAISDATATATPDADATTTISDEEANAAAATTQNEDDSNNKNNEIDDKVDSALLSALRDPKERLGLLKLEQVVMDFLEKQPQDPYIDIGGPYNSTVVSPSLGFMNLSSVVVQSSQSSSSSASSLPIVFDEVAYQNLVTSCGRTQTTFHKCLVHRLGDRFEMARERAYNAEGTYYNNQYIRLCKTAETRFPLRRLLDIPQNEYYASDALQSSMQQMTIASVGRFFGADAAAEVAGDRGLSVRPPNNNSSSSNGMSTDVFAEPSSSGATNTNPPTTGKSKNRKMVIMKRSSSNVSEGSSTSGRRSGLNNDKKSTTTKTVNSRDSLSEKEKKYAEARARIFQQEQSSDGDTEGADGPVGGGGAGGEETSPNDFSSNDFSVPQEGTGPETSTTKATYRNKQQEISDPDFRRGVGVVKKRGGKMGQQRNNAAHAYPSNHAGMFQPSAASYIPGQGYFVAPVVSTHGVAATPATSTTGTTEAPMYYYQGPQGEFYPYDRNAYNMPAAAAATPAGGNSGPGYVMSNHVYPGYGAQHQQQHWQQRPYQYDPSYKGHHKKQGSGGKRDGFNNGGDQNSSMSSTEPPVAQGEAMLKP